MMIWEQIIGAMFSLLGALVPSEVYRGGVVVEASICRECVPRAQIVMPGVGIDLTSSYG